MEEKQTTFMRVIYVQTGDIHMATYEGTTPIDLSVYIFRLYSSEQIAYSVYNGDILIHENPICH